MESSGFVGIILGIGVLGIAPIFFGGSITDALDPVAVFLLLMGLSAALLIQFPVSWLGRTMSKLQIFFGSTSNLASKRLMPQVVSLSAAVRKEGWASFDVKQVQTIYKIRNQVIVKSVERLGSGMDPKAVIDLCEQEMKNAKNQLEHAPKVIETAASLAPGIGAALGILKLVQTVLVLDQVKNLGNSLSGAFLFLVYGLFVSFVFLSPWAGRVRLEQENEVQECDFIQVCVQGLAEGWGPQTLEERLKGMVS